MNIPLGRVSVSWETEAMDYFKPTLILVCSMFCCAALATLAVITSEPEAKSSSNKWGELIQSCNAELPPGQHCQLEIRVVVDRSGGV